MCVCVCVCVKWMSMWIVLWSTLACYNRVFFSPMWKSILSVGLLGWHRGARQPGCMRAYMHIGDGFNMVSNIRSTPAIGCTWDTLKNAHLSIYVQSLVQVLALSSSSLKEMLTHKHFLWLDFGHVRNPFLWATMCLLVVTITELVRIHAANISSALKLKEKEKTWLPI